MPAFWSGCCNLSLLAVTCHWPLSKSRGRVIDGGRSSEWILRPLLSNKAVLKTHQILFEPSFSSQNHFSSLTLLKFPWNFSQYNFIHKSCMMLPQHWCKRVKAFWRWQAPYHELGFWCFICVMDRKQCGYPFLIKAVIWLTGFRNASEPTGQTTSRTVVQVGLISC